MQLEETIPQLILRYNEYHTFLMLFFFVTFIFIYVKIIKSSHKELIFMNQLFEFLHSLTLFKLSKRK